MIQNFDPTAHRGFSGIYAISCSTHGSWYVGSAADIYGRLSVHKVYLRRGNHHSRYLQNVWNKYGEESFEYLVLQKTEKEKLREVEQWWFGASRYHFYKKLLNTAKDAARPAEGKFWTEAMKERARESRKKYTETDKARQQLSEAARKQHASGKLGSHTWSEEAREKIAKKNSQHFRKNPSRAMLGKEHRDETRRRMSLSRLILNDHPETKGMSVRDREKFFSSLPEEKREYLISKINVRMKEKPSALSANWKNFHTVLWTHGARSYGTHFSSLEIREAVLNWSSSENIWGLVECLEEVKPGLLDRPYPLANRILNKLFRADLLSREDSGTLVKKTITSEAA